MLRLLAPSGLTSIDDLVFLTALVGFMLMVVRVFSRLASHTWQTQVDREGIQEKTILRESTRRTVYLNFGIKN